MSPRSGALVLLLGVAAACGPDARPFDPQSALAGLPELAAALAAGDAQAALDSLAQAERRGALPEGALHYRALALQDLGRTEEALAAWRAEIAAHPGNGNARLRLGLMLLDTGALDEAAAQFERARALVPDDPALLLASGRLALLRNEDATAQRAFRDYLTVDPYGAQAAEAHFGLAQVAAARGAAGAAEARAQRELGQELQQAHAYLSSFRARLAADPEDVDAADGAARAFLDLYSHRGGDPRLLAHAEGALAHVLERRPEHGRALYNLGFVRAEQRRFEEAIEYFRRATQVETDFVPARINLGVALARVGKRREALEELRLAVAQARSTQDTARARFELARLLEKDGTAGERAEALELYRAVLALHPEDGLGLQDAIARLTDAPGDG